MVFHAGLPLPGGFVGVDIFFVISGFVITLMLSREWERKGSIHLGSFYLRRLRRLTPAAATVIVATIVLSVLLLPPGKPAEAAVRTGLAASVFIANWVIAGLTGDYFAPDAHINPMLHMWSLSVEEQFYLGFPLLFLLLLRLGRRFRRGWVPVVGIALAAAASLSMLRAMSIGLPEWLLGYYSPVNRAWEFGAGAVVALTAPLWNRIGGRAATLVLEVPGLLAVLASFFVIDSRMPFPGKVTLLPVLGTAALIAGGSAARQGLVARLLSTRPLVAIGDRSYSLYLWHWPVVVFTRVLLPGSVTWTALATVGSALPALLSYRYVEQPFRRNRTLTWGQVPRRLGAYIATPWVVGGVALLVLSLVLQPSLTDGRWPATHPESARSVDFGRNPPADRCPQQAYWRLTGSVGVCRQTRPELPMSVAVVGDSHANQLFAGFYERMPTTNVGFYGEYSRKFLAGAAPAADFGATLAASPSVKTVVITAFWEDKQLPDDAANRQVVADLVRTLKSAGKVVYIYDDVPDFPFDAFQCEYSVALVVPLSRCTEDGSGFFVRHRPTAEILRTISRDEGATFVPVPEILCPGERCSMLDGDTLIYADSNHLNYDGSVLHFDRITATLPIADQVAPPS